METYIMVASLWTQYKGNRQFIIIANGVFFLSSDDWWGWPLLGKVTWFFFL